MPLVYKKDEKNFSIGIWQSSETFDELLRNEALNHRDKIKWESFQSDKRKREWLTVRVLLRTMIPEGSLPEISYDTYGKPSLGIPGSISISHTKDYVAIILSDLESSGIDLESLRERIKVLAPKFVSDKEAAMLPSSGLTEHLHVVWGAKEVLFKLNGRGEIDFRAHLHVDAFRFEKTGSLSASIRKDGREEKYHIRYELWRNMMLAYSVAGRAGI